MTRKMQNIPSQQCKERDVTYAAPLKVRVRLINKETEEINEHEIFMGDLTVNDRNRYLCY